MKNDGLTKRVNSSGGSRREIGDERVTGIVDRVISISGIAKRTVRAPVYAGTGGHVSLSAAALEAFGGGVENFRNGGSGADR